jgi:hypothetical protein
MATKVKGTGNGVGRKDGVGKQKERRAGVPKRTARHAAYAAGFKIVSLAIMIGKYHRRFATFLLHFELCGTGRLMQGGHSCNAFYGCADAAGAIADMGCCSALGGGGALDWDGDDCHAVCWQRDAVSWCEWCRRGGWIPW